MPPWLTVDWLLGQFGTRLREAQATYREFVGAGIKAASPWGQLKGQIYLGSDAFIARYQSDRVIREVPRQQTQARRPGLGELFLASRVTARGLRQAYRRYGYRLREIAEHLGVHYATVSRRLKRAEQGDV